MTNSDETIKNLISEFPNSKDVFTQTADLQIVIIELLKKIEQNTRKV